MKLMPDGAERMAIIQRMLEILHRDTPWVWGYYPQTFNVAQSWLSAVKPSGLWGHRLKYIRIDPTLRAEMRQQWNKPILWPLAVLVSLLMLIIIPVAVQYWRKQHRSSKKEC